MIFFPTKSITSFKYYITFQGKVRSMTNEDLFKLIDQMADSWFSNIVARKKIEEFTGGMITGKTMANYESRGEGPDGKIKLGGNAGYVKPPLVDWLKKHIVLKQQTIER